MTMKNVCCNSSFFYSSLQNRISTSAHDGHKLSRPAMEEARKKMQTENCNIKKIQLWRTLCEKRFRRMIKSLIRIDNEATFTTRLPHHSPVRRSDTGTQLRSLCEHAKKKIIIAMHEYLSRCLRDSSVLMLDC